MVSSLDTLHSHAEASHTDAVNATEYYRAGQLDQATTTAIGEVKATPGDVSKRCFLSDLLCFSGDLERADRQLEAAAHLGGPLEVAAIALRRQLIRAERARRQCLTDGRLPELLDQPSEDVRCRLQAAMALREGKPEEAGKLLDEAEGRRRPLFGVCNDRPFDDFSDLDELFSPLFEIYSSTGKYYWIPFDKVRCMEFQAPASPRDLLWRCAYITFRNGGAGAPEGVVYLPTLYNGSHASADDRIKLGRATDWAGGGTAPYRGSGQRVFDAGGVEISILELARIEFRDQDQKEGLTDATP